jgi:hypothetical protein
MSSFDQARWAQQLQGRHRNQVLTAKDIRQREMEPQAPRLVNVANIHRSKSTLIDTIDHVQGDEYRKR